MLYNPKYSHAGSKCLGQSLSSLRDRSLGEVGFSSSGRKRGLCTYCEWAIGANSTDAVSSFYKLHECLKVLVKRFKI